MDTTTHGFHSEMRSKSALVKQALNRLSAAQKTSVDSNLFALGAAYFGRYGDATRQSARVKRVACERLNAKRTD